MTSLSLADVPPELLIKHILPMLAPADLGRLSTTSRKIHALVVTQPDLWRQAMEECFPDKYAKRYASMPRSVSLYTYFVAEVRLWQGELGIEKLKRAEKVANICKEFSITTLALNIFLPIPFAGSIINLCWSSFACGLKYHFYRRENSSPLPSPPPIWHS